MSKRPNPITSRANKINMLRFILFICLCTYLMINIGLCHGQNQDLEYKDDTESTPSPYHQLSIQDIALSIKTYDRYIDLLNIRLSENNQKTDGELPFNALMIKVESFIVQSEQEACKEHGIEYSQYRAMMKRLFAAQAYVQFSEIRNELIIEIKRREKLSDEDFQTEADRSYQETEAWFSNLQKELELSKKARDEKKIAYLVQIDKENEKIREYNRNLPPDPAVERLKKSIKQDQAKLQDARFQTMHEGIKQNIDKMTEILAKLEKKNSHKIKKEKTPNPSVIESFNRSVESVRATIDSYERNIMKPVRDQKSSEQWFDNVKAANHKKIQENQKTVRQLNEFLSQARLKQAANDLPLVEQVIDRKKLLSLSPAHPDERLHPKGE